MVHVCCIRNCDNRSTRESDKKYFGLPVASNPSFDEKLSQLSALRRSKWTNAIRGQKDDIWEAKDYHRVCSDHFVSGEPANLEDVNNADWVPSLRMGHVSEGHEPDEGEEVGGRWQSWEHFVRRMMFFLRTGSHEENLKKADQRAIQKAAKTYYLAGGLLYHQRSGKPLRVVMLESEHKDVIRQFHVSDSGGHSGINATMDRISSKFFWRGIKQDVVQYISHCCGSQRPDRHNKVLPTESKAQDDDCSSASGEESSKTGDQKISADLMTASSAMQKFASCILKQKSRKILMKNNSGAPAQESSKHIAQDTVGTMEVGKTENLSSETREAGQETLLRTDEAMILDENEGTFVKVDPKQLSSPGESVTGNIALLTSGDHAGEDLASPTLITSHLQTQGIVEEEDTVAEAMSASATIMKLVSTASKEKTDAENLKGTTSVKQKSGVQSDNFPRSPTSILKSPSKPDDKAMTRNYRPFASSLFSIGMRMVRQQVYKDLVEIQELKDEQNRLDDGEKKQLEKLKGFYYDLRVKNRYLATSGRRCRCGYRVGSRQELELHHEYGHGWDSSRFDCCLCKFTSKVFGLFSSHMWREHGRKARLQLPMANFVCPYCPFEHRHNTKKKLLRHIANCERNFQLDQNLSVRAIDADIPLVAPTKPVVPVTSAETATPCQVSLINKPQAISCSGPVGSRNQRSLLKPDFLTGGSTAHTTTTASVGGGHMSSKHSSLLPASNSGVSAYEICELCGGFIRDRRSLQIHIRAAHQVDVITDCVKSPQPPLSCAHCSERFWTPQGITRHVELMHKENPEGDATNTCISVCPLCKRTRLTDVMMHLSQQHRITLLDMFSVRYCLLCLLMLHTEKAFEDHMVTKHSTLYPSRSALMQTIRTLEQSRSTSFSRPSALLLAAVNRNRPAWKLNTAVRSPLLQTFPCPICRCQFDDVDELTAHFEHIHSHKCCRCESRFSSAVFLRRHIRDEHKDLDICSVCLEVIPAGVGATKHLEQHHLRGCSIELNRCLPTEELIDMDHALRKRRRASSVSDQSETRSISGDDTSEESAKRPKLDAEAAFDVVDLDD